jgi:hypothetical protein
MPEDISDDFGVVLAELGQFLSYECADADVLEPDRVHHSTGCLADTRSRRSGHGLRGESFDNDSAEAAQIYEGSEFDAIPKGTAGGNHGIFEREGTYADSEVNSRGPFVNACRLGRTHWQEFITLVKVRGHARRIRRLRIFGGLC